MWFAWKMNLSYDLQSDKSGGMAVFAEAKWFIGKAPGGKVGRGDFREHTAHEALPPICRRIAVATLLS
jgi:hypothetical protein